MTPSPVPPPVVVELTGEIDIENALAVGDGLCAEIDAPTSAAVIVDCAQVTFVESRGLAMMARVQRHAQESGVSLVWWRPNESVLSVIRIAGLDPYLTIRV